MAYSALATILALFVYIWVFINVGRARTRTGIAAPAVTGNAEFERYYRVQMNMVEQMALFIPALWLFSLFVSPLYAFYLGVVWSIGRVLYALGYYKEADKRHIGFGISAGCSLILLLGATWGVGVRLLVN